MYTKQAHNRPSPRAAARPTLLCALGLLLAGCVQTMPTVPVALLQPAVTATDVQGGWTGTYVCAQGRTTVRLYLQANGTGGLTGRFDFSYPPGSTAPITGSFAVAGSLQQGRLELAPAQWLVRPAGYDMVRVSASYLRSPDRLVGNVPSPGCGAFEAVRDNSVAAPSAPPPPQQQPSQPAGSGQRALRVAGQPAPAGRSWVGDWVGTLDCGKGPVRLRLLLSRHRDPMLGVRGEILSIHGKKPGGVPYFTMLGEAEGDRMRLRWEKWVGKPLSDRPMNFDGEYAAGDDALILKPLENACRPFTLARARLDTLSPPAQTGTASTRAGAADTGRSQAGMSFSSFMAQLGERGKNEQRLVGSTLQLRLQPGSLAGGEGFVQDPQAAVLFRCPARPRFTGGEVTAKIARLRVIDDGVVVDLDRCGR